MPVEEAWTIARAMEWCRAYLEAHGDPKARLSAEWLLSAASGLSRVELYAHHDRVLSMSERDVLRESLKRRGTGEPLQYVCGEAAFRHIVVKCESGVFIPRPETEMLVELALAGVAARGMLGPGSLAGHGGAPAVGEGQYGGLRDASSDAVGSPMVRALEVGTGTGCIACSLAREAGWHVTATDVSHVACELARRNVDALGLGDLVEVVECDCVSGIPEAPGAATADAPEASGTGSARTGFDVLVSNPPYVPSAVVGTLDREVRLFEPEAALDGGADGLAFLRRLLDEALPLVRPGGFAAFELFEEHTAEAARLLGAAGMCDVEVVRDLTGRERFVTGVKLWETHSA